MSHIREKSVVVDNDEKNRPYEGIEVSESKFWRKVKQDPAVPIGLFV
jgi:hypothetical protein